MLDDSLGKLGKQNLPNHVRYYPQGSGLRHQG